jgi:hypothetical protein
LIIDTAAKVVEKLQSLPPDQKEGFMSGVKEALSKLLLRTDKIEESRKALPTELPNALP